MDANVRLLLQRWLIDEPALYRVLCTHDICENKRMGCNVRCGEGKIEYNPDKLTDMTYGMVNELFRAEAIRIILKHPYDRQPDCCNKKSSLIGSNLVLGDNYSFDKISMPNPSDYGFDSGLSFEQYSFRIQDLLDEIPQSSQISSSEDGESSDNESGISDKGDSTGDDNEDLSDNTDNAGKSDKSDKEANDSDSQSSGESDGEAESNPLSRKSNGQPIDGNNLQPTSDSDKLIDNSDQSELWQEDPLMQCAVDSAIEEIKNSGCGWGSVSANHVEQILASTKAKIDYRKVLAGFRSTILSSKRHLTRMRPNRRSGFDNMGSIRRYDTKLLVGVDVSGSVCSESLRHFFSVISRLFKYGIEKVDVIQFDCSIKNIESFGKAEKTINIVGRRGTNFQPVVDYAAENQYDGLIIFTDGFAPEPNIKKLCGCKLAWVCDSEGHYKENSKWMKKQGRCCFVEV